MPLPAGFCTETTFSLSSWPATPTGSACGSNTNYFYLTFGTANAFPAGQHYMRVTYPHPIPAPICFTIYGDLDTTEHTHTFNPGDTVMFERSFDSGSPHYALGLRTGGGSNDWFLGTSLVYDFKNAYWEPACGPPPPPCQYGTRAKATSPLWGIIGDVALSAAMSALDLSPFEQALVQLATQQVDITQLCTSLPPNPPPMPPDAVNYPPSHLLQWFYPIVWRTWCECIPGTPAPVAPPPLDYGDGSKQPQPRVIVINPTNPCLDITEVRQQLDRVLRLLGVDVQLDTLMQRYALPFATVRGATHSGLAGTGSFAVSRLIGVQIQTLLRGDNRELEGAPPYVWDLGWISIMDGNGFIQERRITRDADVWMPRGFQEATVVGYHFKDGVLANITELQAET